MQRIAVGRSPKERQAVRRTRGTALFGSSNRATASCLFVYSLKRQRIDQVPYVDMQSLCTNVGKVTLTAIAANVEIRGKEQPEPQCSCWSRQDSTMLRIGEFRPAGEVAVTDSTPPGRAGTPHCTHTLDWYVGPVSDTVIGPDAA